MLRDRCSGAKPVGGEKLKSPRILSLFATCLLPIFLSFLFLSCASYKMSSSASRMDAFAAATAAAIATSAAEAEAEASAVDYTALDAACVAHEIRQA